VLLLPKNGLANPISAENRRTTQLTHTPDSSIAPLLMLDAFFKLKYSRNLIRKYSLHFIFGRKFARRFGKSAGD